MIQLLGCLMMAVSAGFVIERLIAAREAKEWNRGTAQAVSRLASKGYKAKKYSR